MQEKRDNFIDGLEDIDPKDIIVIDEAGADLTMATEYARAEGGARIKAPKPFTTKEKYSIIGAISMMGIVAVSYLKMSVNASAFIAYIKKFLLAKLGPNKYVVLDNVKFHKNQKVISLIESTGAKVVFLPPYSPDLSPIEKMWSKIKEIIKRLKPRNKIDFHNALTDALLSVVQSDCEEWFDCCGYL